MNLGHQLERARRASGFTQDHVAASLGVSRAMISYWEADTRTPNEAQLAGLAKLFRCQPADFYKETPIEEPADEARMFYRRAALDLDPAARLGIGAFVDFLAAYAQLADECGVNLRGMTQSPFVVVPGFESADDARAKRKRSEPACASDWGPSPTSTKCVNSSASPLPRRARRRLVQDDLGCLLQAQRCRLLHPPEPRYDTRPAPVHSGA